MYFLVGWFFFSRLLFCPSVPESKEMHVLANAEMHVLPMQRCMYWPMQRCMYCQCRDACIANAEMHVLPMQKLFPISKFPTWSSQSRSVPCD